MDKSLRTLVMTLTVILALALLTALWMPWGMGGMMGDGTQPTTVMPWHGGMGGMGVGWIVMIGFWALVGIGVVALLRTLDSGGGTRSSESPLDIAKRRYASGEITREVYEQIRKDLGH